MKKFILRGLLIALATAVIGNASAQGVYREMWTNLNSSLGSTLTVLTNTTYNPNWPNNPAAAYTKVFTNFETATDILDNYGQRVRTLVVPPVSGDYTFWIASDDSSLLYLSSGENPTNKVPIASVNDWTAPRIWDVEANQQSAPITLEGGRRYYLEAIMEEYGGGDNLAVRWKLPNGTFEEPMTASTAAGTRLIPFTGVNTLPGFFVQPTNTSVLESSNASFALLVTNQSAMTYQWQRSSTNLAGATKSILTVSNTSFALDNGRIFRCVVSNASGAVTSAPATLTVVADTIAPTIAYALNQDFTHVALGYSEAVEPASATNVANYSINSGVTVSSATLSGSQTVTLLVSTLTLSNTYTVTVNNVRDRASTPNSIAANSQATFTAKAYGLTARPAVGAFLNNLLPSAAPAISGNWSAVVAFTNLVFTNALGVTAVPGTTNLIVWEREGRIYSFTNTPGANSKTLVLDISNQCQGWDDSGLLNVVFHPGFATNRFMYVYYTWVTPGTVVGSPTVRPPTVVAGAYHDRLERYTLNAAGVVIPGSVQVLVDQIGNSVWHNGSGMFFHPGNGFLYVANGDDEDGVNNQTITNNLFSGVWRIDVDKRGGAISHAIPRQPRNGTTTNYFIPNDNPFVGQSNVLEEFFAIGLRSPHRMTCDPVTGRIFIGDVGEGAREEIDLIEPTDPFGFNFQWNVIEGLQGDLTPPYIGINKRPVLDYTHSEGQAVIGGHVYRGSAFAADLGGKYIFADNVSKNIWAMDESTSPAGKTLLCVMPTGQGPNSGSDYTGLSSFGLDASSELYFCQMSSIGGQIFKLARAGAPPASQPFPPLLSQTGAFADLPSLTPSTNLIAYTVNSPLWSDGAVKQRWVAIPTSTTVHFAATGEWTFPSGSVFVKHFSLPVDDTNTNVLRRLETRFIVRDTNNTVYGITYKWRTNYTDADFVTNALTENILIATATGSRTQQWFYPGPLDCLRCHTAAASYVLGLKTRQLNGNFAYTNAGVTDNQLRAWNHVSLFDTTLNEATIPTYDKLVQVTDTTASLTNRVRSYLDANCSQCHRPGGAPALWDARYDTPLASQGIINGIVGSSLGITGAKVVVPQDLAKSIMHVRMNSLDTFKMPPLARNTIDSNAVAALAAWINILSPIAPTSLVAIYNLDGNALDTSGNGNHGTANGVSYVTGRIGAQAAQFNGTTAYIQIPRSISNDFTVTMWLKTTNTGGTGTQWYNGIGLVDGEVAGAAADWGTAVLNGKFALGVGTSDTTLSSSVAINDGNWHHVAGTRNNTSGAMNVYVDGVLRGSGTGPTGVRTAPPVLRLGSLQTGINFLNGTLDDVRLYNQVLTAGDIAALVALPAAPTGLTALAGDGAVALNWNFSTGATGYNVKRSTISGGPYSGVATNIPDLNFTATGLANGTRYYFVVSALNPVGEGTNSIQATAQPVSAAPTQMSFALAGNQLQLAWPLDHTGWRLQTQTNALNAGLGTNWVTVPNTTLTNLLSQPVDSGKSSVFFRLIYP